MKLLVDHKEIRTKKKVLETQLLLSLCIFKSISNEEREREKVLSWKKEQSVIQSEGRLDVTCLSFLESFENGLLSTHFCIKTTTRSHVQTFCSRTDLMVERERETRESWNKKTASGWSRLCLTWVMLAVTCCPFQWIRYHPLLMMILSCLVSLSLINLHLRAWSYFISYWSCIRRRDKEGLKKETKRHLQTNGDNELREFVYNISAYKLHSSSHLVTPFIKDFPFFISHDTTCCSQLVCFFSDNDRK